LGPLLLQAPRENTISTTKTVNMPRIAYLMCCLLQGPPIDLASRVRSRSALCANFE
jgi:hypothetical protein